MAQHISLRVPWHDNGWDGTICKKPGRNVSCLRLKSIFENRNEMLEEKLASCRICDIECRNDMPCIREGGAFMSPDRMSIIVEHPYRKYGYKTHMHLLPTEEIMPPYSYPARPYRWTMKKRYTGKNRYVTIEQLAQEQGIDYHPEYEPEMKNDTWVQDGRNHRAIFDVFFRDVEPEKSLCIFYSKQVPFTEDPRRVVLGIGRVKAVNPSVDYKSSAPDKMTSCTWETMIEHSIRENMEDGFLLPYKELAAYAENDKSFDLESAVVFAENDFFEEFSYASEHISHDAVIDVILQCIDMLEKVKKCAIPGDWNKCILWLNQQLIDVWEDRGAFPGLGAMLVAFGIPSGVVMARELQQQLEDLDDLWELLDTAMDSPEEYLSDLCANQINATIKATWKRLPKLRREVFKLLARVSLSIPQAQAIYNKEQREKCGIIIRDKEILENPYLLYEQTRDKKTELQIPIKKVDMAFFPPPNIENQYPIGEPSKLDSAIDWRRVRALAVSILEDNALQGNTIMPINKLVTDISQLTIEPECHVTGDIIAGMTDEFKDEIIVNTDEFEKEYYKLVRYKKIDGIIERQIRKRVEKGLPLKVNVNWRRRVDSELSGTKVTDDEENARREKAAALKVMAEARFSVLIGGAGTGKTTVLSILCQEPEIQNGGILLLAPTGKARVRMKQMLSGKGDFETYTIAQYLRRRKRYNPDTHNYRVLESFEMDKNELSVPKTVIVDEASMLTEEMFGALMDAVKSADRIIFVGDTSQLPPIGAGRPFVDTIRYLRSVDKIGTFPETGRNYARLKITRRQISERTGERDDVRLAQWYTDDSCDRDEGIFARLQSGMNDGTVVFRQWSEPEELEEMILETIREIAGMKDIGDEAGFNRFMGATSEGDGKTVFSMFDPEGCAYPEKWQILSPVRNNRHGVLNINHLIHEKYRRSDMDLTNRLMGPENIVHGDKVINVINKSIGADEFIANGEIGMVSERYGFSVEFVSQPGRTYSYSSDDFSEEDSIPLELAYALTVHKSQGSQFGTVILVLDDKCFLASRELFYTALTRQRDKLIILYNAEAYNLHKYSSDQYSDIAKRFTDLFKPPRIVETSGGYYEEDLIHRAVNGTMVRSKSELAIANLLCSNGYGDFIYENKLPIGNSYLLPDFTIKEPATGITVIWEHCGLMGDSGYKERWERKKKLYEANGYSEQKGNLIVTADTLDGGLDSAQIQEKIDEYLL